MNRNPLSIIFGSALAVVFVFGIALLAPQPAYAGSCTGTWQYQESDISDASCVNPAPGACVPNPNNTNFYSALATCPNATPGGSSCTVGSPVLLQGVKGPTTYGSRCKWNSVEGNSNLVNTDIYSCVDSSGQTIPTTCGTATPEPVTAGITANPTQVLRTESSLLTWSSTGATACTGTNFDTGGAPTGTKYVTPSIDTKYSVNCSGAGGSATASVTVLVIVPLPPDPSQFSISCRASPSLAKTGQDVFWTSTVAGPVGTYAYSWSGTDGLSGSGNQVIKKYTNPGTKTASLTVTFTPQAQAGALKKTFAALIAPFIVPAIAEAAECPAGQTAVPTINYAGASCTGGTKIAQSAEMLDAVQIGLGPNDWMITTCTELGAIEGDCCELAMRASNNVGGGFPPNSYIQFRVIRGGSPSSADASFIQSPQCNGTNLDYSCSSVAGVIGTQCTGVTSPAGSETKTVQCDNPVVVTLSQCSDTLDNDGDGRADYPQDPGCVSPVDDDESDTSQCSDGLDNDGDGRIDAADPSCHTDGNGGNPGSYDPSRQEKAQCADGLDNDGDAKADTLDPGCHTDANAANAASYNPNDNDERNTQCSDGLDNDGNGKIDCADAACHTDGDVTNAASCDPNINDESNNATLLLSLAANASLVQYNTVATLAWSATNVVAGSCRITGTNGTDYSFDSGPLPGKSGTVTTTGKPLKSEVIFTLSCRNFAGQTVDVTTRVRVAPSSGEF